MSFEAENEYMHRAIPDPESRFVRGKAELDTATRRILAHFRGLSRASDGCRAGTSEEAEKSKQHDRLERTLESNGELIVPTEALDSK